MLRADAPRNWSVLWTWRVPSGCVVGSSKKAYHPPRRLPVSA
jgi:hypothetical protein